MTTEPTRPCHACGRDVIDTPMGPLDAAQGYGRVLHYNDPNYGWRILTTTRADIARRRDGQGHPRHADMCQGAPAPEPQPVNTPPPEPVDLALFDLSP